MRRAGLGCVAFAVCVMLLTISNVQASEGKAEVWTNVLAPIAGSPAGKRIPVTVHFRDDQFALTFTGVDAREYRLLQVVAGAPLVMLDNRGGGLPLPRGKLPLFVDPATPCGGMGMMSDCRKLAEGIHSGRNAVHWAYRRANRAGPAGSDSGQMWVDSESGLLLSYTGMTLGGQEVRWQVDRVSYELQPDALFELPEQEGNRQKRRR